MMTQSSPPLSLHRGRCNCGAFVFEAPEPDLNLLCLCKCCQRASASLGQWLGTVPLDSVRWVQGSLEKLSRYDDQEVASGRKLYRAFCGACGAALFQIPPVEDGVLWISIPAMEDQDAYVAHAPMQVASFSHRAPQWMQQSFLHHLPTGTKVEAEPGVSYRLPRDTSQ